MLNLQWIVVTRTASGHPIMSFGPFHTAEDARNWMRNDINMNELLAGKDWVLTPHVPIQ